MGTQTEPRKVCESVTELGAQDRPDKNAGYSVCGIQLKHTQQVTWTGACGRFDDRLDVKLSIPGTACNGTRPEQLFAAG